MMTTQGMLESIAAQADWDVHRVWRFLFPEQEVPDNIARSIRALVAAGADSTTICGAIVMAAQKKSLSDDDVFTYACGIVRNQLAARDEISLLCEPAAPEALGETEPPRKRWWRRR